MVEAVSPVFSKIFAILIGEEGGFTSDPNDPGNWTGGAVGAGVCKGTKYGISAASFPGTNIEALTQAQAETIYAVKYWQPVDGDAVPAPVGLMLFDAAVNNGVEESVKFMQRAIGVTDDGVLGPETRAARTAMLMRGADKFVVELLAQRMNFMGNLSSWSDFGLGWSRRLAALPFKAQAL